MTGQLPAWLNSWPIRALLPGGKELPFIQTHKLILSWQMSHQDDPGSTPGQKRESCRPHLHCQPTGSPGQIPACCLHGLEGSHQAQHRETTSCCSVLMGRNRRKWAYFAHPVESLGKEKRQVLGHMGTLEVSNFASGSGRDLGYPEDPYILSLTDALQQVRGEGNSLSCLRLHL